MQSRKKIVPFDKRRYYDFKKPIFENALKPTKFEHAIKLERFTCTPEHLGFGYVVLVRIDNLLYSMEGQRVFLNNTVKRDGHFVDVQPTEYFKNDERQIKMNGSYFHGFHYFKYLKDAKEIANTLFKYFDTEIVEASIYYSNARGIMFGLETHVTTEFYLHERN